LGAISARGGGDGSERESVATSQSTLAIELDDVLIAATGSVTLTDVDPEEVAVRDGGLLCLR
jgi:hypothetical protein